MTISGGVDWVAKQAALQQWALNGSGLTDGSVFWGQQNRGKRPAEPGIEMRLSIIDDVGLPWADATPKSLNFGTLAVTAVVGNSLTITAHGLSTGDGPGQVASTGVVPSPLSPSTNYWVIRIDNNTIQLAATFLDAVHGSPAGSSPVPITLLSTGSGTITIDSTPDTVQAGHEIQYLARGVLRVCLTLTCYTSVGVGMDMATSILRRIASRRMFPSQIDLLQAANIGVTDFQRVLAVHGQVDAVRFEPRAYCEVYLNIPSEEAEDGTIITTVTGTDQILGQSFTISDPDA